MDKQQKIAIILLPILAIALLAGGMFISNQGKEASANTYTDGTYIGEGEGFGGTIKVEVKVDGGKITSIEILEHGESAGIADPAIEGIPSAIISAQNPDVDTVSGATYSSEGIMEAVKNALSGAGGAESFTDGEYEGIGEGFGGDIKVKVLVDGGKITSVEILEHSESAGISDPAIEGIPLAIVDAQSTSVDVESGATYSSEGIMEAVKNALAGDSGSSEKDEEPETEPETTQDISDMSLEDGSYEGTGKGFGGDIKVKVEVADGKVSNIEILEHGESAGIADPAINDIPGEIVDAQSVNIDSKSGATYSSDGIKAAVMDALSGAIAAPSYEDGSYEGIGKGFGGDIKVKVEVKDSKIVSVEILEHGESAGIADPAINDIPGEIVDAQSTDVDSKSGATYSSDGIKAAVEDALK